MSSKVICPFCKLLFSSRGIANHVSQCNLRGSSDFFGSLGSSEASSQVVLAHPRTVSLTSPVVYHSGSVICANRILEFIKLFLWIVFPIDTLPVYLLLPYCCISVTMLLIIGYYCVYQPLYAFLCILRAIWNTFRVLTMAGGSILDAGAAIADAALKNPNKTVDYSASMEGTPAFSLLLGLRNFLAPTWLINPKN